MIPKPLSVRELAALLGIGSDYIYDQCRARVWVHTRIARKVTFTEEQVRQILAACEEAPKVAPVIPISKTRVRRIA